MATKRVSKKVTITKKEVVAQIVPQNTTKTSLFPKITRFITESWKMMVVSFLSGLLIMGIFLQGLSLQKNLAAERKTSTDREKIAIEINRWKKNLEKYPDYRDGYYKLASLEYKLGNIEESKKYIKKALRLDPNFKEGQVLGAEVGL